MRQFRAARTLLLIAIATLLVSAAGADLPLLDPLAKPGTRIGPFFQIALDVCIMDVDEVDLCKTFALDREGRLQVTIGGEPLDKISLLNMTSEEAVKSVTKGIRRFYRVDPVVKLGIVRIPRMRVEVFGATLRSGAILLAAGSRLSDALAESGYFADADLGRVKLERTAKDGSRVRILANFGKALEQGAIDDLFCNPVLENGDIVTLEVKPRFEEPKMFGIHGEVKLAGFYPFKAGMTVRDALREGGGLLPSADVEAVTIVRGKQKLVSKVNAQRAIEGIETDNLELRSDDMLWVGRKDRGMRYSVAGAVARPETWDYKGEVTLTEALVAAGGILPEGDRKSVVLSRNMIHDPAHSSTVVIDYEKIANGQMPDPKLQAGDVVTVLPRKKRPSPLLQIGMFVLRRFLPF
jgi:protein involved in polysaccharide export with SLBB domain